MAKSKKYITCNTCNHKYLKIQDVHSPVRCPECKELYWRRPIVEKQLMDLQDKYFKDRSNNKPFQEMIIIIEQLLHNLIASKLKSSAVYLEEEKRHDLVMDSLLTFMEKYNKNPDFKITGSFIGYLKDLVLNPLYNPKKKKREQLECSLSTPLKKDKNLYIYHLLEVVEGMFGSEEYILNKFQEDYQIEAISYLLDNIFIQCVQEFDIKTALIIMRSLYLHIDPKVSEKEIINYWKQYSNDNHVLSDFSIGLIYNFVKDEICISNQIISYEEFTKKFKDEEEKETYYYTKDLDDTLIEIKDFK